MQDFIIDFEVSLVRLQTHPVSEVLPSQDYRASAN